MKDCMAKWQSMVRASVAVCCVSMVAAGCGGNGANPKVAAKPKASADGKVTFDGNPVVAGTISFTNIETGNSGSGKITDGTYTVKVADGANPGQNAVVIIAKEKAGEDDKWQWAGKADVPAAGYKGDFAITKKQIKPVRKKLVDD